jgi:hypothetical protein
MWEKMNARTAVILSLSVALLGLFVYRIFGAEEYTKTGLARAQVNYVRQVLAPIGEVARKSGQRLQLQEWILRSGLNSQSLVDPWGEMLIVRCVDAIADCSLLVYSKGPNRTDESGAGDDISAR